LAGEQEIHAERDRKLEAAGNNGRLTGSKPLDESRSIGRGVRRLNFRLADDLDRACGCCPRSRAAATAALCCRPALRDRYFLISEGQFNTTVTSLRGSSVRRSLTRNWLASALAAY